MEPTEETTDCIDNGTEPQTSSSIDNNSLPFHERGTQTVLDLSYVKLLERELVVLREENFQLKRKLLQESTGRQDGVIHSQLNFK